MLTASDLPAPVLPVSHGRAGPLGLYIHIPFCVRKCAYCDFNSYAGLEQLYDPYLSALVLELRRHAERLGHPRVDTIYVGGGTPTVLHSVAISNVLSAIGESFQVDSTAEITIEANPWTVGLERLDDLGRHGVNRLSIGVQSLNDDELRLLGRIHNASQAREAVATARAAAIANLNLDLIYGLPGQSLSSWLRSLNDALRLEPDHLSLYCLTIEEGTPLFEAVRQGDLPTPDPDLSAEMYERARDLLGQRGFEHYELSNWARVATTAPANPAFYGQQSSRACLHNCKYWTGQPYLGIGAGAHSYLGNVRWQNVAHPSDYIDAVNSGDNAVVEQEPISEQARMAEAMFLGLRLVQGVRWDDLRARLGCDMRERYAQELTELASLGLLTVDAESAKLTQRGQLLGNQVFVRFLPNPTSKRQPVPDHHPVDGEQNQC